MNSLWHTIGQLAAKLHRDRVESIAEAIAGINSLEELEQTRHAFGPNTDDERIKALRSAWSASPSTSPREIAAALLSAVQAAEIVSSNEAVELVWTGPQTGLIPTRNTEQVILEVVDFAKSAIFVVSYVFHNASSIINALNSAIARGVQVSVLLESSTEHGGAVQGDSVQAMADAVPDATIYVWDPDDRRPTGDARFASVHAKCAVADGWMAFVTSANLTSAALERNMELGLLIRGGSVPKRLQAHLNALVATRMVRKWK